MDYILKKIDVFKKYLNFRVKQKLPTSNLPLQGLINNEI
jgi:hypothetical protein